MALVRGELDWIVMKCLEKDRDRRYETANGLARDIQRYLAGEPVEARPPARDIACRSSSGATRDGRSRRAGAVACWRAWPARHGACSGPDAARRSPRQTCAKEKAEGRGRAGRGRTRWPSSTPTRNAATPRRTVESQEGNELLGSVFQNWTRSGITRRSPSCATRSRPTGQGGRDLEGDRHRRPAGPWPGCKTRSACRSGLGAAEQAIRCSRRLAKPREPSSAPTIPRRSRA